MSLHENPREVFATGTEASKTGATESAGDP